MYASDVDIGEDNTFGGLLDYIVYSTIQIGRNAVVVNLIFKRKVLRKHNQYGENSMTHHQVGIGQLLAQY